MNTAIRNTEIHTLENKACSLETQLYAWIRILNDERSERNGMVHPDTADSWGTLGVNLRALARRANTLADYIDIARGQRKA